MATTYQIEHFLKEKLSELTEKSKEHFYSDELYMGITWGFSQEESQWFLNWDETRVARLPPLLRVEVLEILRQASDLE